MQDVQQDDRVDLEGAASILGLVKRSLYRHAYKGNFGAQRVVGPYGQMMWTFSKEALIAAKEAPRSRACPKCRTIQAIAAKTCSACGETL